MLDARNFGGVYIHSGQRAFSGASGSAILAILIKFFGMVLDNSANSQMLRAALAGI